MWCRGSLDGGPLRKSLRTRSWERAEEIKRRIEAGKPARVPTIDEALDAFLAEQVARAISVATQRKLKPLVASLKAFCVSHGLTHLNELDLDHTRLFRLTWKDSPISAAKKLERLRAIFNFFLASRWTVTNPARAIKRPVITDPPTCLSTPVRSKPSSSTLTENGGCARWCSCTRGCGSGTP
jgi:hypothetical protein